MDETGRADGGRSKEEERGREEKVVEKGREVVGERGASEASSGCIEEGAAGRKAGDIKVQLEILEEKGPMSEKEEKAVEALLLVDEDLAAGSWSPVREKEIFFFPKVSPNQRYVVVLEMGCIAGE